MMGGCKTSTAWDRALTTGPDAAPGVSQSATLRTVPWERVQATFAEIEKDIAASDVHPDEWSAAQKAAEKAKLLKGLQVSQDPTRVLVLGHSQFSTTDNLAKAEKDLGRIAHNLGADMVVWSSRVLGKTDSVVDRPVTSSTWGTGWFRDNDGERRPDTYTEHTTSWVPVRVSLDEVGAVAYFLRVNP